MWTIPLYIFLLLGPSILSPILAYQVGKYAVKIFRNRFLVWLSGILLFLIGYFALYSFWVFISEKALKGAAVFSALLQHFVSLSAGLAFLIGLGFLIQTIIKSLRARHPEYSYHLKSWTWTVICMLAIVFIPSIVAESFYYLGGSNKQVAESIVLSNLKSSCAGHTEDCTETRSLPAILQGKKIIVATSSYVVFEPGGGDPTTLDVNGFIDLYPFKEPGEGYVSPSDGKRGYLQDREFSVIRAAYDYHCSYCFDSSDFGYVILENTRGYRFMVFLSEFATSSTNHIPWDQQVPFQGLGKEWFLEPKQ